MAKKEDPFVKGNLKKTLDTRKNQHQSIVNVVDAIDGEFKARVAEVLMEGTDDTTPNYDLINRTSDLYDEKKAQAIIDLVDSHYDVKNRIHPLRKALTDAKVDKTTRTLIENLYSGHKDDLKKAVGSTNYIAAIEQHMDENLKQVRGKILSAARSGYNMFKHGDDLVEHLKDTYRLDMDKVDVNAMKNMGGELIQMHVSGQLNDKVIYNSAPKYKGKKKEAA